MPLARSEIQQTLRSLQTTKASLKRNINSVLYFLLPSHNRRSTERRSNKGQRFIDDLMASHQHDTGRRNGPDRRLPPQKRLRCLRGELLTVLQIETKLHEWKERELRQSERKAA